MKLFALTLLAAVNVISQKEPNKHTISQPAGVYAAQATASSVQKTSHVRGKVFDRFVTIWLENTDYKTAAGDENLAWLASQGITLSNYFALTHPSEPNYVASQGGDTFGMDNDGFNNIDGNVSAVTVLLEDKGISWGSYEEGMPYTGYQGYSWNNRQTKANDYVRKHNPVVIYDVNTTPERLELQNNFTIFYEDLDAKRLPQWMFITPNLSNDGHDTSVTVAGQFCRRFLTPLMKSQYFMERTLILITFDENHTSKQANKVFSILLGGALDKNSAGTIDETFYNHYSELSTVEANWGLHTLGRWDVGANVFRAVAEKTGDISRPHEQATGLRPTIFYNSSFAGPFNHIAKAPYPAPNLHIESPKTGRTVLPAIVEAWKDSSLETYYTDSVIVPDGQHPPPGYAVHAVVAQKSQSVRTCAKSMGLLASLCVVVFYDTVVVSW